MISKFFQKSEWQSFDPLKTTGWEKDLRRKKWVVFLTITFGYGFYYVSRLSFNVVKKSMVDGGIFTTYELGIIGSGLFFAYAFGKLTNGILADRVNIRRFMAFGLFVSGLINVILGLTTAFWAFMLLWTLNGWVQSIGAPSSVVAVSRWTRKEERGSLYGIWSSSHNIGEAITFIGTAVMVTYAGWMWGMRVAGGLCMVFSIVIYRFLYEAPEVYRLPSLEKKVDSANSSIGKMQWAVFRNPAIWLLALASAFFYVTRYAVNSWGIFFLEAEKGYTNIEAGAIVSVNSVVGIAGTFFSGILSDKFFKGSRFLPAVIFGLLYILGVGIFVFAPGATWADSAAMVMFGLALGVLLVYLGGLMAIDICPPEVAGTALGAIGIASYLGAALQDIISGYLIENAKMVVAGQDVYDFEQARIFWVGASILSLCFILLVWWYQRRKTKNQMKEGI